MRAVLDNAGVKLWLPCGPESAQIAARDCMAAEIRRPEVSYGFSGEGGFPWPFAGGSSSSFGPPKSKTVNYRTEIRQNVLPSEVQGLAYPSPPDFTARAFLTASHLPGPLYCEQSYRPFVELLNRIPKVPAFRPRPKSHLWLRPWDHGRDGDLLEPRFIEEA